jgi:hypothetical protein
VLVGDNGFCEQEEEEEGPADVEETGAVEEKVVEEQVD